MTVQGLPEIVLGAEPAGTSSVGRPVDVSKTGRCPRCNARVVYLRGPHTIKPYSLMSTNGKASGICLRLVDGRPELHSC